MNKTCEIGSVCLPPIALLRKILVVLALVSTVAIARATPSDSPAPVSSATPLPAIEVHFSPGGECTAAIVREITGARQSIHLQAYSFTSAPIAQALVVAHRRGVAVTAILDRSNRTEKYSAADFLAHEKVDTYIDSQHAISHNKVMTIDHAIVITGSFNFTKAAEEKNAENLLIVRDRKIAAEYERNWDAHFKHSEYYPGR